MERTITINEIRILTIYSRKYKLIKLIQKCCLRREKTKSAKGGRERSRREKTKIVKGEDKDREGRRQRSHFRLNSTLNSCIRRYTIIECAYLILITFKVPSWNNATYSHFFVFDVDSTIIYLYITYYILYIYILRIISFLTSTSAASHWID